MSKQSIFALFLVASLLLTAGLATTSALSGTEVSGTISQNTTWTKAGGPYTLTGTVFVNNGITLTIEAGATVYLNDHSIRVNGTLTARGAVDNQITFISLTPTLWNSEGIIVFLPGASGWNEQAQSGCIVQYANITYNQPVPAFYIDASSPKISNCTIIDPLPNNYDRGEAIEIVSSTNASAAPIISFNTIGNAAYIGIYEGGNLGNSVIYGNYIYDCDMGVWSRGIGAITNNLFRGNNYAISIDSIFANDGNTSITNRVAQNNTFIDNYCALSVGGAQTSVTSGVAYNNFEGNVKDLQGVSVFGTGITINVSRNWWGTTDQSAINSSIDAQGAVTVGLQPILTAPNAYAPSSTYNPNPAISTPTPTASPTPNPTASPASSASTQPTPAPTSQQPSNTVTSNSPTPTQTPSPSTVPEFSSIALILGIIAAIALVTLAYTKKNKKQIIP
jgi:Uncharacterized protein conserved in bacteria